MSHSGAILLLAGLVATAGVVPAHGQELPPPWTVKNIGKAAVRGTVFSNSLGLWTFRAQNGDLGTTPKKLDEFLFCFQPLVGDGSITALLVGQEGGDPQWGKTGLMLRESDAPGARNVFFGMSTGPGLVLSWRPVSKGPAVLSGAGRLGIRRFPLWLRLQRDGDRFTPFASTDGVGWLQLHASVKLPGFAGRALAGVALATTFGGPGMAVFGPPLISSGNGKILLEWPEVPGAVGYLVRRSAPQLGGFAADLLTAAPVLGTSFADTGLPNGRTFRYLVSALRPGGEGMEGWPCAVLATPLAVPGELVGTDVEVDFTQYQGGIAFDPLREIYTISGSGSGIGASPDRFFYAHRWISGDFQITARLLDRPSLSGAQAGVMVRESLAGPARMLYLAETNGLGITLQQRKKEGASVPVPRKPTVAEKGLALPLLLRLVRRGNTLSAFLSQDGVAFKRLGEARTFSPPLAQSLYVGYAISARNPNYTATNSFRDLVIGPAPP